MENILDLIEPDFEFKSVCYPSYTLHCPEWSHIPRPKLFGTWFLRTVALFLLPDAPRACDSCQSSVSGSPMLFSSGSWRPELLSGHAERSELHQTSYPGFPQ